MKLSHLISAFLATWAVASPIPDANVGDLDVTTDLATDLTVDLTTDLGTNVERGVTVGTQAKIEETPEYKAAIAAHAGLKKDHWYWFDLIWPNRPEDDQETDQEVRELRQRLGFAHIGLVVGQITETEIGKGKNLKIKKDFKAVLYHMVKENKVPGDTRISIVNYKVTDKNHLKWGGETTKKKADALKKEGNDYVATHKIYKVDGNNCNDFVQALVARVR